MAEKSSKPGDDGTSKGEKKEQEKRSKSRFIVFIGNLPFTATKEEITEHFKAIEGLKEVRLLTRISGESKGCGFLEFDNPKSQQKSLNFHHTQFQRRKINLEVTCGGGGKSEKRKEKIVTKNKKVNKRKRDHAKSQKGAKDDVYEQHKIEKKIDFSKTNEDQSENNKIEGSCKGDKKKKKTNKKRNKKDNNNSSLQSQFDSKPDLTVIDKSLKKKKSRKRRPECNETPPKTKVFKEK